MDSHPDLAIEIRWPGGRTERRPIGRTVTSVGRHPANDIALNSPTVSARHLQLVDVGGHIELTDLHSTNGTQINGRFVESGKPHEIRTGDVVRIGDPTGNSIAFALAGGGEPLRPHPVAVTTLTTEGEILIGRDQSCALCLDHPTVSRKHAEIVLMNGGHAIRDLGSGNGSWVNGRRVVEPVLLAQGDAIRIGPFLLDYDPRRGRVDSSVRRGYRLEALDLGVAVGSGRMILDRVSMTVEAGEFVALVGGSGAGKSTLMKAMNGYNRASHGRMLIDGQDLYQVLDAYRTQMGFVPQDDIIHRELPVRVALWHAARLRLPDATPQEIESRVADVLKAVDLTVHGGKPVSVLSGGQRKRVSIAVELLSQPALLFLDEPTSGLDPGLEKKMMYDLSRLADDGRTVLLVTHATANIEQCHHVAFLAHGRLAYFGPPRNAIVFFRAQDFADIYLKLSAEIRPEDDRTIPPELAETWDTLRAEERSAASWSAGALWAEHYCRSSDYRTFVQERQQPALPEGAVSSAGRPITARDSVVRQVRVLARREFDLIRHDLRTLLTLLLLTPFIAGLFGAVSHREDLVGLRLENTQIREELKAELRGAPKGTKADYIPVPGAARLITMLCLALTQAATFGAAYHIVKERAIFKREHAVNLRVASYVLSKALVLGSFAVIQVASALLMFSLRVDLNVTPIFHFLSAGVVELFLTMFLASVAGIMFGLFISAIVPSADVVVYVMLAQMFTQIVLSGTYFPLRGTPISRLAIANWAVEAVGSTAGLDELNGQSQVCQVVEIPGGRSTQVVCNDAPLSEKDLAVHFDHTPRHLLYLWMGLLIHAVFWCGLAMWVQAKKKLE